MGKLSPLKLIVILNGVKNLEILRLWLRMTFPKRSRLTDYLSNKIIVDNCVIIWYIIYTDKTRGIYNEVYCS